MKQLVLAVLFILSLQGCGNVGKPKNEEIELAVNTKPERVAIESLFHCSKHIGISGEISYQWKKSDSLCAHASTEELIRLATDHHDIVERLIVFRALLTKDPHVAVNLAISEIEDTTKVSTLDGDCGQEDMVSNVRISMIQYNRKHYNVSLGDSVRIDSALLFSDNTNKFDYMYHLYQKLPAKPEYEERLRQLYEHNHYALIALARYHREDIKQEIVRLLSQLDHKDLWSFRDTIRTALDAVIVWPSESYKQQVRQTCQNILGRNDSDGCNRSAFGALMAYNDKWSYNFIDKILSKAKQKGQNYFDNCWMFHEAYEANPLPLFKPLLQKYRDW